MRLQDVSLSRPRPDHFKLSITIRHPAYIRGEDTMFSQPRLDKVEPHDETDYNADDAMKETCLDYGVHFATMLLACQVIAGNSFETAYLSYDRKGTSRVQLGPGGILMHDYYYLHVPKGTQVFPSLPLSYLKVEVL